MEPVVEKETEDITELLDQASKLVIDSDDDDTVTAVTATVMPADNRKVEAIVFIYASVNAAQNAKSGFSMDDCEKIFDARNTLLEFFSNANAPLTQAIADAYTIFDNACQFQQRQGAFTIEGSCKLKKYLNELRLATIGVMKARDTPVSKSTSKSTRSYSPPAPTLPPRGKQSRGGPPAKTKRGGKK